MDEGLSAGAMPCRGPIRGFEIFRYLSFSNANGWLSLVPSC
jgi:hypothetical protein